MASEDATDIERQIQSVYTSSREQILDRLRYELMSDHPTMMKDLPQDMMAYMAYIYNWLSDSTVGIVQKTALTRTVKAIWPGKMMRSVFGITFMPVFRKTGSIPRS